ncbi:MAG: hypothetical protein ACLQQ4_07975 [Bacteroidia bacterium]
MKTQVKAATRALTEIICIISAIMFVLFPKVQKAQSSTTGIVVGASTASVSFSNVGNSFANTIKGNDIMGFEGGIFERLNIGPFFIKPMLLLGYQSGMATYYNSEGSSINSYKFDYGNIEVPFLLGLKIIGPLRIEAGPVFNWIYNAQYYDDNYITIDPAGLGYRVGANVELGMINLGLAYQGLTNNSSDIYSTTFKSPEELIFSLALCFGN